MEPSLDLKSVVESAVLMALKKSQRGESELTFAEYTEKYYLPYYAAKERKHLKSDLKCFGVITSYAYFSAKKMVDINKNDIQQLLYRIESDRGIAEATVNRYRAKLSAIFNHAVNERIVANNPVEGVGKRKEQYRSRYLNFEEAQRFLAACKESRNRDLYDIALFALYTGMREGEILGLRKDNIVGKFIKLKNKQTKSRHARAIPIHQQILPMVEKRVETAVGERLFTNKSIRTAKERAIKRAKLDEFKFHDVRRTCATWLKDSGVDIHTISKILGHSSITMTERYLASSEKHMSDAINTLPSLDVSTQENTEYVREQIVCSSENAVIMDDIRRLATAFNKAVQNFKGMAMQNGAIYKPFSNQYGDLRYGSQRL